MNFMAKALLDQKIMRLEDISEIDCLERVSVISRAILKSNSITILNSFKNCALSKSWRSLYDLLDQRFNRIQQNCRNYR
jgi:hypothetical protein